MSSEELYNRVLNWITQPPWSQPASFSYKESVELAEIYRALRCNDAIRECKTIPEIVLALHEQAGEILLHLAW